MNGVTWNRSGDKEKKQCSGGVDPRQRSLEKESPSLDTSSSHLEFENKSVNVNYYHICTQDISEEGRDRPYCWVTLLSGCYS